jgi:hypothetical protein
LLGFFLNMRDYPKRTGGETAGVTGRRPAI